MSTPAPRIVEMACTLTPTGALRSHLSGAKEKILSLEALRPGHEIAGRGVLELRVAVAPAQMMLPSGYYAWAVLDTFTNGPPLILLGGAKPTATEAAVEGSQAYEAILKDRG